MSRPASAQRLVAEVAARLYAAGVPSPQADARLLVRWVEESAGWPQDRRAQLDRLVAERAQRIPLQLLIGRTWFRHLSLECRPGVFIPRPETEIVAGVAVAAAQRCGPNPGVADLGTGTGAIALSVVAEVRGARVWATEVSEPAVALARHNLRRLIAGTAGVEGPARAARCTVLLGDLVDPLPPTLRGRLDVVVSNPPYLPIADHDQLPPEVADHDPAAALFGGGDGHEQVNRVFDVAASWLRPGGTVVVEIDERRADDATAAARAAGLADVDVVEDLTGAPRAVTGIAPERDVHQQRTTATA